LFCLDCTNKSTESHNPLDLCSELECIAARVTHRKDLEGTHEPNHRLVKIRTVVLRRQHGLAHTAGRKAFERVEPFCKKIAEASEKPEKNEKNGLNAKSASSPEPTSGHVGDSLSTSNDTNGDLNSEDVGDTAQEPGDKAAPDATLSLQPPSQNLDNDLPTCGNCNGPLSFPFWYCVVCEG
jgi:hypothetical protein